MIEILCFTNLALFNEKWPKELPAIPRVGEEIESMTLHASPENYQFRLSLEVCKVRWVFHHHHGVPEVELHICSRQRVSLNEWYDWYAPLVGKTRSYFI